MLLLINNTIKKACMKNVLFLCIVVYLSTGCSQVKAIVLSPSLDKKQLSCSQRAKPKSLQLLEQQYRCTRQE